MNNVNDDYQIDKILREVNLDNLGNKKIRDFSLGMKQRFMFVDRMGSVVYRIKSSEAIYFLCLVVLTIILFYQLTWSILKMLK